LFRSWTRRVQWTHGHLINTQGVRAEFLAEIIRANRILQRLAHLAVFLIDLFAVVEELAVLLLYLGCWYVDATGIGVGISLDVALVVQATVWLLGGNMSQVKEHLVPETRVQQVQHGVLHTADVQVNAAWIIRAVDIWLWTSPVTLILNVYYCLIIDRVNVAQLVEGRTCPLRHDVGITVVGLDALTQVEFNLNPLASLRQRWLWLGISIIRIERHRLVVLDLWQLNRQHRLRQCVRLAILVEIGRDTSELQSRFLHDALPILRHDVGITVVGLDALTQVEFNLNPLASLRQRWLWLGISIIRIERHRLVVLDLWQLNRQHRLRQCVRLAILV